MSVVYRVGLMDDLFPSKPRLLRPKDVAEALAVDPRTVLRLIDSGRLPGVRVGSRWRVRREDLAAYLDAAT